MKAKPKKPTKRVKKISYYLKDSSGLGWRMVGSRPVSALADSIMRDLNLPLR